MFENSNNASTQPNKHVDDIFADTDKLQDKTSGSAEQVMTRRVGLSAAEPQTISNTASYEEEDEKKSGGKGFTIAVIIMSLIILGLIGFLVYSKFFSNVNNEINTFVTEPASLDESDSEIATTTNTTDTEDVLTNNTSSDSAFVDVLPSESDEESTLNEGENNVITPLDTDNDGIFDNEENILGTNILSSDTDNDGLGDYQEVITYKTSPLKVDTDGDKLTDYEEIIIYKTNPLLVDTDNDNYSDGSEAMSGYDPLLPSGALLPEDLREYKPIMSGN